MKLAGARGRSRPRLSCQLPNLSTLLVVPTLRCPPNVTSASDARSLCEKWSMKFAPGYLGVQWRRLTMDRERWQQIERLYHAAWAQPADARARFLVGACPDAKVRREVESLIAQATGGYLATGAGFAADSPSDEQSPGVEGRRLGVTSPPPSLRIARGGSSTGHLPSDLAAEQLDRLVLFSLVSGGLWAIGSRARPLRRPTNVPSRLPDRALRRSGGGRDLPGTRDLRHCQPTQGRTPASG